jgi:hypothetical protein
MRAFDDTSPESLLQAARGRTAYLANDSQP